jgi:uncharacterized protein (DUF1501 family)
MLRLFSDTFRHRGRLTRRELLRAGALTFAGLSLTDLIRAQAIGGEAGRAKHCIFVFLNGGASQHDTVDMKPDAPEGIRGPYKPIATSVPDIHITEKLPLLARLTDKLAIVRSANHHLLAHNTGASYALSGHSPGTDKDIFPKPTNHPSYGAVVSKVKPSPATMPSFVLTPRLLFDMGFPTPSAGGGWLGNRYDPFPVVRNRMMSKAPKWKGKLPVPEGLQLPQDVSFQRLAARKSLLESVDETFADLHRTAAVETLNANQQKAFNLVLSPESRAAFDLTKESVATHARYGRHEMGQVLLLSRRLVEAGVRFVTANAVSDPPNTRLSSFQIWDTHFDHFRLYNDHLMPELDQSLSALIEDLETRGLLAETLLLIMGEFGRTPKINDAKDGGRDHWSKAYSVMLAGGGIDGGQVYGATDKDGAEVKHLPVSPDDSAATLYESMGIPHDLPLKDMKGQPHRISDGQPIWPLFG